MRHRLTRLECEAPEVASVPASRIVSVPVIFVTAFPERLLTGTKPEPTFLVRKPFNPEALKAVISQALFFDVRGRSASS